MSPILWFIFLYNPNANTVANIPEKIKPELNIGEVLVPSAPKELRGCIVQLNQGARLVARIIVKISKIPEEIAEIPEIVFKINFSNLVSSK